MDRSQRIDSLGDNECVFVDDYDDNSVWISIHLRRGSASTVLSREQALELIEALQKLVV